MARLAEVVQVRLGEGAAGKRGVEPLDGPLAEPLATEERRRAFAERRRRDRAAYERASFRGPVA